jgi:hypothetical protein
MHGSEGGFSSLPRVTAALDDLAVRAWTMLDQGLGGK